MKEPIIALALILGIASFGLAQGRGQYKVTPGFTDEGRDILPISTACYPSQWTVAAASDSIRRHLFLQWVPSNVAQVCLSTTSKVGDSCGDATAGITLSSVTTSIDVYSHVALYCRAYSSVQSTQTVKGYSARDRSDYGDNGAGPLQ